MNRFEVKNQYKKTVTSVVLGRNFPKHRVEVSPENLPSYIDQWGYLIDRDGSPLDLIGVKIEGNPSDCVSYANFYWYRTPDLSSWSSWHLYIGVSHAPGIKITRLIERAAA